MIRLPRSSPLLLHGRIETAAAADAHDRATLRGAGRIARVALLVFLLTVLWIVLIGWAARAPLSTSFEPSQRVNHSGNEFHVVIGAGVEDGRRLGINAVGAEHMALQSLALDAPIDAEAFPMLRYRWQDFPRTLELSFLFRRADDPDDVHTIALPPAASHPAYFDLGDVAEWHGRIVEIGFAEFPTAQLVPANVAFRPFALAEAELWSPSWRGSLGALGTDWAAYRPWALMSVSALGPDAPWPHKKTPVLVLAIGLFLSVLLGALVLARNRAWIGTMLCVALAAGWLALDLRWLGEFADRHVLTRDLYAGKPWRERATIEPDTAILASADRVRDLLMREPADAHVVVVASSVYDVLRLSYHLLPANVAPIGALAAQQNATELPRTLLVVYAAPEWTFDAHTQNLRHPTGAYRAEVLFDEGDLRIFNLRGAVR
ncbi:MAG: hypothetical protein ACREPX_11255 [Rhodanobacteraceae bacterium]